VCTAFGVGCAASGRALAAARHSPSAVVHGSRPRIYPMKLDFSELSESRASSTRFAREFGVLGVFGGWPTGQFGVFQLFQHRVSLAQLDFLKKKSHLEVHVTFRQRATNYRLFCGK